MKLLAAGAVLLLACGCATPSGGSRVRESERAGLFQQLNRMYGDEGDEEGELAEEPEVRKAKVATALEPGGSNPISIARPLRRVVVTSPFGERSGDFHDGVDLKAAEGTPVYASHSGLVLYADRRIRGYGKMIVLKHSSGLSTVYAHNSRLLVRRGQRIIQGQRIALSGATGNAKGPHLHYEVRQGMKPIDPAPLLAAAVVPQTPRARAASANRRKPASASSKKTVRRRIGAKRPPPQTP